MVGSDDRTFEVGALGQRCEHVNMGWLLLCYLNKQ